MTEDLEMEQFAREAGLSAIVDAIAARDPGAGRRRRCVAFLLTLDPRET